MIAPLRRRHRWLTTVLAVVVLALYVAALAGRPAPPIVETLPAELMTSGTGEVVDELGELFTHPITTRIRSEGAQWQVELEPREPLARPEVLVYWAPDDEATSSGLPSDAFLLGALAGTRERALTLPGPVLGRPGRLLLYSLGHQEIVDSASMPAIGSVEIEPSVESLEPVEGAADESAADEVAL